MQLDSDELPPLVQAADVTKSDRLKRALLAAFPDRLAKRREPSSDRGVMVGGRGVRLDARSQARSGDLFLCIDVDSKGIEATVRMASQIDEAWLDARHVREVDEPFFDAALASVVARRRRYFHDLILSESPIRCKPGPRVATLLATEARKDLSRVFPRKEGPLLDFVNQVRFLQLQMPQLNLPPLDDSAIDEVLVTLCQTRTSFAELSSAPWLDHLRGRYDYQQLKLIDQHAPVSNDCTERQFDCDSIRRGQTADHGGSHSRGLRMARDTEDCGRQCCRANAFARTKLSTATNHRRPRQFLARNVRASSQGTASTLSQTSLAGGSDDRGTDSKRFETTALGSSVLG